MLKNFIYNSIEIIPALLFPALGGLFTSIAGNLNTALEGFILIAAFFSCSLYLITGNIILAIFLSIIITCLVSLIQSFMITKFNANNYITGLSINMFSLGFCGMMSYKLFNHNGVLVANNIALPKIFLSDLSNTSILGSIFMSHNVFVYMSIFIVIVVYFVINKTMFGLKLRSIGLNKIAAESSGVNTKKYIIIAFFISALFSSLSGIYLFLQVSSYTPNMSASKGWIALVLIFLGREKPFVILLTTIIFTFSDILSNYVQGVLNIPTDFILAIPFVICLLFLVLQHLGIKKYFVLHK